MLKFSPLLSLLCLCHFTHAELYEISWSVPTIEYSDRTAEVGDQVKFTYSGSHDVYIHPSDTCDEADRQLIGAVGDGSATYEFTESDVGSITFACDFSFHCELGQKVKFIVKAAATVDNNDDPPEVLYSRSVEEVGGNQTSAPTETPSMAPTESTPVTEAPTLGTTAPTPVPTPGPTLSPTGTGPTLSPTGTTLAPTGTVVTPAPTLAPTETVVTPAPTLAPTETVVTPAPTESPSFVPTNAPVALTPSPTVIPVTSAPTASPVTQAPTITTAAPTVGATAPPTAAPTVGTTAPPTVSPTVGTTSPPTIAPVTGTPTVAPVTVAPTVSPVTAAPTFPSSTPSPTTAPVTAVPAPTIAPVTVAPTLPDSTPFPTIAPTIAPVTVAPTPGLATPAPSIAPITESPTLAPVTAAPTPFGATADPTVSPTTAVPTPPIATPDPTTSPTTEATGEPTTSPTTAAPTLPGATPSPTTSPTTAAPTPPGATPSPTTEAPTTTDATPAPTALPTLVPVTPSPTTPKGLPTVAPTTEAPTAPNVLTAENLEMTLLGMLTCDDTCRDLWVAQMTTTTREYYESLEDGPKLVSNTPSLITRRRLQDGEDGIVLTYNHIFELEDEYEVTANELAGEPLAEESARDQFTSDLKAQDPAIFNDLDGVTAIDFPETPAPSAAPNSETPAPQGEEDEPLLSTAAIIGIAVGGGVLLIAICGCLCMKRGGNDGDNQEGAGQPPNVLKVPPGGDEVSTLAGPQNKNLYGDQSVATVDYDYSKAYGGGGDTSVSEAGGTFGSTTQGLLDPANAAATGGATFDGGYAGGNIKEELIHVFAPPGKLGVVIDTPDDGAPVVHAVKDSSVIADKIQVGDKLVAVDDEDVRTMTAIKVSKLISRKSANPSRKLSLIRTTVIE